jgi:surface protein
MELSTVLKRNDALNSPLVPKAAKHVVFTDQPAPSGVKVRDVSQAQDGGVVAWDDSYGTFFISAQRPGTKVTAPEDCSSLFAEMKNLESFDGTMLDVSRVQYMCFFFDGCKSLAEIIGLQNWDTSHVMNMDGVFADCYALQSVDSLANWDVSAVRTVADMFYRCKALTSVDALANWNVSNAWNIDFMFGGCPNLTATPSWCHNDDA